MDDHNHFHEFLGALDASTGVQGTLLLVDSYATHSQCMSFLRNAKVMCYPPI
jgi:hypothetical protein